jgi:hypothetical protein
MPTTDTNDLDDADKAVLAMLLHQVIAADPVPLSARVQRLRAILTKLEPPSTTAAALPGIKPLPCARAFRTVERSRRR